MKQPLTDTYLEECLRQARYYEYCKDSDRALKILHPIWSDLEQKPDIEGLTDILACQVLLICGGLISYYGTHQQKKNCQEMAADLLMEAREIAINIGERNLIAEAEKQIAVAYWRTGQYENALAFSNTVIGRFTEAEQMESRVCLLTKANLLMLYVKTKEHGLAYETFEKIYPLVEQQEDLWVKTIFYNQAGMMFLYSGKFNLAVPLLLKTVSYAQASRNELYVGNASNNLAFANLHLNDLKTALSYAKTAAEIFSKLNQPYAYAQVLDTKAQIFSKSGKLKEALLAADESIAIFRRGENYAHLAESLWTRTQILMQFNERHQGLRQYNDLIQIVKKHLSLTDEDFYTNLFNDLIYIITGNDFDEIEANFRRRLLDKALALGGGIITASAKILKVDHQRLSKMVSKFPDLKEKHNVKLINRSTNSFLIAKNKAQKPSREASVIALKTDRLKHIGLPKGATVRFERCLLRELDLSKPVVIQDSERKYHCGFLVEAFDMLAFEDGLGNIETTFVESEILDAGQVVEVLDEKLNKFISYENF